MELKIDDKELAKEVAALAVERLRHYVNDNDAKYMFYHESVDRAVQKEVCEIIRENKDKIFNAVVDKLANSDKIFYEQKAEIERLTEEKEHREEYNALLSDYEACRKRAVESYNNRIELQKQVDELKAHIRLLVADCDDCKKVKQAVKDTAKEILDEISESDILVVQTQEYGEIEVVSMERLKEIIKSKGVEVE